VIELTQSERKYDMFDLTDAIAAQDHERFEQALKNETDRSVAIVAGCMLDDLLEKLLKASFVKSHQVKSLFSNDRLLQSFFAKISIAYCSGLIPTAIYHDLRIICEIRNRFAHGFSQGLSFNDTAISGKIGAFELIHKSTTAIDAPRLKFQLGVVQIAFVLRFVQAYLVITKDRHVIERLGIEGLDFSASGLSKQELAALTRKLNKRLEREPDN
jgi:DNA-binding MltR family transcriptional regulator